MKLQETFPKIFLLNLARRQDRRARCEQLFEDFGLEVERFPAVDARRFSDARGFQFPGRYAHALSCRLILRRAMHEKWPAVFIFEDDVTLHPDLHQRLEEIELPEDWGMVYLGGTHHERPVAVAAGLVRVRAMLDTQAFGVRASHYREVMAALKDARMDGDSHIPAADVILGRMMERIPTYAPYPSLAGQREEYSDLVGATYRHYTDDCQQSWAHDNLRGIPAEALGGKAYAPVKRQSTRTSAWFKPARHFGIPEWAEKEPDGDKTPPEPGGGEGGAATGPQVAFLFLTRGEVNHPQVWEQYWSGGEGRRRIYSHIAQPQPAADGWLKGAQIPKHLETRWGDISLVRTQLALLAEALKEGSNTHFIFVSESCVPVRPFAELLRLLRIDSRSRFNWKTGQQIEKDQPEKVPRMNQARRVTTGDWRFHSQWVLLNREAAELVCEDDFTGLMEAMFAPDESYVGTVLQLKGYPLHEKVAPFDPTLAKWKGGAHPEAFGNVSAELVGEIVSSGPWFARKFDPRSNIGEFGLHLPALSHSEFKV
ncbi:MAG: glycosyltransferase family 25 protein [Verrucomicrobiales bacterium]|nr:glycosyltransferase family 25 protein [Verrucomicrobiales bacterium]